MHRKWFLLLGICFTFAFAQAETVEITGVHLCCGKCIKAVAGAVAKFGDVKAACNKEARTVSLTADDPAQIQRALDALAAAGFSGKAGAATVKGKGAAKTGKVSRLEVSGVHNCCGKCCKAIKAALKNVAGVTADTAEPKKGSFVVEGNFKAEDVLKALRGAGLNGQTK